MDDVGCYHQGTIWLNNIATMTELTAAIGKLKNGKAGGASGILPEMIKAGCSEDDFLDMMMDLVETSWKEKKVHKDWSDAVLVPRKICVSVTTGEVLHCWMWSAK